MTTKRLEEYIALKQEARDLKLRIRYLDGVSAIRPKQVPGKSGPSGTLDDIIIKRARLRRRYEKKLRIATEVLKEIEDYIDTVDDPEIRTAIRLKYVDGLTWRDVGKRLRCDHSGIRVKVFSWVNRKK